LDRFSFSCIRRLGGIVGNTGTIGNIGGHGGGIDGNNSEGGGRSEVWGFF
jgi:hypothetical protein